MKNAKDSSQKIDKKSKMTSSMSNTSKNVTSMQKGEHKKNISNLSKEESSVSDHVVQDIETKQNPKESNRYSSYLSLKARNT
jgi:hypothetical protein